MSPQQPLPHNMVLAREVAIHLFQRSGDFPRPIYIAMAELRPRRQMYLDNPDLQTPPLIREHMKDGYTSFAIACKALANYDKETKEEIPTLIVMFADRTHGEWHTFTTIITKDGSTYLGDWNVMRLGSEVADQMKLLPTIMES